MIDLTKPVQTRDGQEVRLYNADKLDGGSPYVLHGAILDSLGWQGRSWTKDGSFCVGEKTCRDLVNIPVKRSGWINIYRDAGGDYAHRVYISKGDAESGADINVIATIPIEWEE